MLLNIDKSNPMEVAMSPSPWSRATPFLLRGFLRLVALAAPLLVVFAVINVFGERRVSWLDHRSAEVTEGVGKARQSAAGHQRRGRGLHPLRHRQRLPVAVGGLAAAGPAPLARRLDRGGTPAADDDRDLCRSAVLGGRGAAAAAGGSRGGGSPQSSCLCWSPSRVTSSCPRVLPAQSPGVIAGWDVLGATVPWLVVSLLVLAVAEAFGIGARLAHDVDGLV